MKECLGKESIYFEKCGDGQPVPPGAGRTTELTLLSSLFQWIDIAPVRWVQVPGGGKCGVSHGFDRPVKCGAARRARPGCTTSHNPIRQTQYHCSGAVRVPPRHVIGRQWDRGCQARGGRPPCRIQGNSPPTNHFMLPRAPNRGRSSPAKNVSLVVDRLQIDRKRGKMVNRTSSVSWRSA